MRVVEQYWASLNLDERRCVLLRWLTGPASDMPRDPVSPHPCWLMGYARKLAALEEAGRRQPPVERFLPASVVQSISPECLTLPMLACRLDAVNDDLWLRFTYSGGFEATELSAALLRAADASTITLSSSADAQAIFQAAAKIERARQ